MNILILGAGAQGSTVAQNMNEENNVGTIVCADYDDKATAELERKFSKVKGFKLDARKVENILELVQKVGIQFDLIVNALPLHFAKSALEAALTLKTHYQDFAAGEGIGSTWLEGIQIMYNDYGRRFKEINRLAIIGTGSAPGLLCLATRVAVKHLDSCDTIYNNVYEGVFTKRFIPFWFSPITALSDMAEPATAFINGELVSTDAFSLPIYRDYDYVGKKVRLVEHAHDEPVYYGINSEKYFKGVKNAFFKYGGLGIEFAEPLARVGLLSHDKENIRGVEVAPFDVVLKHVPDAPKYKDELKAIIDEGIIMDSGCAVAEALGYINGEKVRHEIHIFAPGLVESFEKAGISAEQYLTGQSGGLYTKLFVENKYNQTGLISSDMLSYEEIDYYMSEANKLGITFNKREYKGW